MGFIFLKITERPLHKSAGHVPVFTAGRATDHNVQRLFQARNRLGVRKGFVPPLHGAVGTGNPFCFVYGRRRFRRLRHGGNHSGEWFRSLSEMKRGINSALEKMNVPFSLPKR
jgi:hypothetical protein